MIKNYLIVAVRYILCHKAYSFINLIGLVVGMTCTILILLWIQEDSDMTAFMKTTTLFEAG